MHDLKFKAARFDDAYLSLPGQIRTQSIRPVVAAYVRNMERVGSLIKLPPTLAYSSTAHTIATVRACLKSTGNPFPQGEPTADIIDNIRRNIDHGYAKIGRDLVGSDEDWESAVALLTGSLADDLEHVDVGIESVLSGAVLGTWTAFEAMAGDLWEAPRSTSATQIIPNSMHGLSSKGGTDTLPSLGGSAHSSTTSSSVRCPAPIS